MSLNNAGKIFAISALDGAAGLMTGSVVELLSPEIANQGVMRLAVEALLQLGVATFLAIEVEALINRVENDPTNGLPFTWGVFMGMPNTVAKLGLLGKIFRGYFQKGISQSYDASQGRDESIIPTQQQ